MYSAFDAVDSVDRWCPPLTLEGGEVLNLTDFQVIDEPAFNKLRRGSTCANQARSACSTATSPRPTAGPRWCIRHRCGRRGGRRADFSLARMR
ncbi:hypothetical protein [Mesorhizobium sp. M1409]|uniref:hypothetical protein n=1 Tax=unclassified Mesorhizobium TaxID=325217 RepID=UPI00333DA6B9